MLRKTVKTMANLQEEANKQRKKQRDKLTEKMKAELKKAPPQQSAYQAKRIIINQGGAGGGSSSNGLVKPTKIIIDEDGDYSLEEKPIMVMDNGVLRQKLDVDGDPIWEKTVVLPTPPTAANTQLITMLVEGVKNAWYIRGRWEVGSGNGFRNIDFWASATLYSYFYQNGTNWAGMRSYSPYARVETDLITVTVRYTKA
jgi:hypothetical protein